MTILHTNDMHANFVPREALWVKEQPRPLVGGFAELQAVVESLRTAAGPTLLLDAGDVMTGNPICERWYAGVQGGALFEMMNMIGYDVWTPGNHDLDISQDNLRDLVRIARFPTVSSNVVDDRGELFPGVRPYTILERGGLRIGIIGIMSQYLSDLVYQANLTGLRVLSPDETLQKYVDLLDPSTDLLIALTHQGADNDSALAASVRGLDIIVGGHSHTRLRRPSVVNGILIVQAGANAENLGVLTVTVEDDAVVRHSGQLITLWAREGRPATPLSRMADSLSAEITKEYSEVLGTLTGDWIRGGAASPIGSFVSEAQREAAGAEVAFMNIHGIRKDIAAGPVTKKDLFEALPFRNQLVTFQLSGRELANAVRHSIQHDTKIQMTGLSAGWRRGSDGSVIVTNIRVLGEPLDPERMYRCAATDYFVGEADRYLGVTVASPVTLRSTLFEVTERAFRTAGVVTPSMPYTIKRDE